MRSSLFKSVGDIAPPNQLMNFLQNYPPEEFWRFFVERSRYDARENACRDFYKKMKGKNAEEFTTPFATMMTFLQDFTFKDLYDRAGVLSQQGNDELQSQMDKKPYLKIKLDEKIVDYINKQIGWCGFEDREPGYLLNITQAFSFILKKLAEENASKQRVDLDLKFIKEIHRIATQNVKNMMTQTPGSFRINRVQWGMSEPYDSLAGLIETLQHLMCMDRDYQHIPGVTLLIDTPQEFQVIRNYPDNLHAHALAKYVWQQLKREIPICYRAEMRKDPARDEVLSTSLKGLLNASADPAELEKIILAHHLNTPEDVEQLEIFLADIHHRYHKELEAKLAIAATKEHKLIAIFTYLKRIVLQHPFKDGTGRTYSMLLLQYLLMRENLLPVLIKDSNMIPGFSVKELVAEYLRAEAEMLVILNNAEFVKSEEMVSPNVNVEQLLTSGGENYRDVFHASLNVYREAREYCLAVLGSEKTHGLRQE